MRADSPPLATCTTCGRPTIMATEVGRTCWMDGCQGIMLPPREPGRRPTISDVALDEIRRAGFGAYPSPPPDPPDRHRLLRRLIESDAAIMCLGVVLAVIAVSTILWIASMLRDNGYDCTSTRLADNSVRTVCK